MWCPDAASEALLGSETGQKTAQACHPSGLSAVAAMAGSRSKRCWTASPLALSRNVANVLILWGIPLAMLPGLFET